MSEKIIKRITTKLMKTSLRKIVYTILEMHHCQVMKMLKKNLTVMVKKLMNHTSIWK